MKKMQIYKLVIKYKTTQHTQKYTFVKRTKATSKSLQQLQRRCRADRAGR